MTPVRLSPNQPWVVPILDGLQPTEQCGRDELWPVLLLELAQTLHVGWFQRPEVLAPAVDRLRAHAVLLRDLRHRPPIGLPQDRHHLGFREPALLYGSSSPGERHSLKLQLVRKTVGRSPRRAQRETAATAGILAVPAQPHRILDGLHPPPTRLPGDLPDGLGRGPSADKKDKPRHHPDGRTSTFSTPTCGISAQKSAR